MKQAELFAAKIVRKPLTEEQREKQKERNRKWYASLSEEQKKKYIERVRKYSASLSEEQKEKYKKKKIEYRASLSEEQKKKWKKWKREYSIKREASLDLDQRRNRKIGHMYIHAKKRAQDRNLPFNIIKQDIADAWPKDDYCPALRIALRIRRGNKGPTDNSPSLDRVIPHLGYVKGNIAVVSRLANQIMSSARPSEVIKVGKWFDEKYYEVKDKLNV
jgi:hypothetical protein